MATDPRLERAKQAFEIAKKLGDPQQIDEALTGLRREAAAFRRREELRAEYPSRVDRALIATGKEMTDLYRGGKSLVQRVGALLPGGVTPEEVQQAAAAEQAEADRLYEPMRQSDPTSAAVGSMLPYLAAPARSIPGMMVEGAALGAASAGTEPMPEVVVNTLAGATLDPLLGKTMESAIGPAAGAGRPPQGKQDLLQRGRKLNFQVLPSFASGNKNIGRVEAGLESSPFTGGHIERVKAYNQERLNEVAARSVGETVEDGEFTPHVLDMAHKNLGARYRTLLKNRSFDVIDPMLNQLARIEAEMLQSTERWLPNDFFEDLRDKVLEGLVRVEEGGGSMSGEAYQNIVSHLGSEARKAFRQEGGHDKGFAIMAVKEALDGVVAQAAGSPVFQAELRDLRDKWRNLAMLDNRGVIKDGNISGPILRNTLERGDEYGFKRGNTSGMGLQRQPTATEDLYDAVRFTTGFRDAIGTSGTSERKALADQAALIAQSIGAGGSVLAGSGSPTLAGAAITAPLLYKGLVNAKHRAATAMANSPGMELWQGGITGGRGQGPTKAAARQLGKGAGLGIALSPEVQAALTELEEDRYR